jgi:hypothetical protein
MLERAACFDQPALRLPALRLPAPQAKMRKNTPKG